jgi:hypothetical protein
VGVGNEEVAGLQCLHARRAGWWNRLHTGWEPMQVRRVSQPGMGVARALLDPGLEQGSRVVRIPALEALVDDPHSTQKSACGPNRIGATVAASRLVTAREPCCAMSLNSAVYWL